MSLDLDALGAHLAATIGVAGPLEARLIAGGRSNLTYAVTGTASTWIVRMPPSAGRTPSAHDVAREARITRALETTAVPVARTLLLVEDEAVLGAPFTVTEFVDGRTIRSQDDLATLDDDELDRCVDGLLGALAALHAVDPAQVGLDRLARPDAYAERQIKRWSGQWELVAPGPSVAADELVGLLRSRIPDQRHTGIVHGDFRIDNTLLDHADAARVRAVVDWELSTLGDPVADVAMMCAYRHPGLDLVLATDAAWTSPRLPDAAGLAERYAKAGGVDLEHWDVHLALAFYKLAVIAQGIAHRRAAGATDDAGTATAGDAVEPFLAEGLAVLRAG